MMTPEQFDAMRREGGKTLLEAWEAGQISNQQKQQYVFDFEFVEGNPCLPISLAIVQVAPQYTFWPCSSWACQQGEVACTHAGRTVSRQLREGYWEWPEAYERASSNAWLTANVRPHLEMRNSHVPKVDGILPWTIRRQALVRSAYIAAGEALIASEVRSWLGDGEYELIASYGAYDFFLLSQLLGGFQNCPKNFPFTYRDAVHMDLPRVEQVGVEHNALADARTIRAAIVAKSTPR